MQGRLGQLGGGHLVGAAGEDDGPGLSPRDDTDHRHSHHHLPGTLTGRLVGQEAPDGGAADVHDVAVVLAAGDGGQADVARLGRPAGHGQRGREGQDHAVLGLLHHRHDTRHDGLADLVHGGQRRQVGTVTVRLGSGGLGTEELINSVKLQ